MRLIVILLMVVAAGSVTLLLWPKSDPLPGAYYVAVSPTKTYGNYKYQDSLNTIDAHHYLHEEYDRYYTLLVQPQNSPVRLYYYAEILETCYVKDQALNLGSVVYQKNKKR